MNVHIPLHAFINPHCFEKKPDDEGASVVLFCQPGEEPCPLDPFVVVPDRSKYVDQQTLKLQENPEVGCAVVSRKYQ